MAGSFSLTSSQQQAIDPQASVWVTANAGTGKTKVLTDRVLRLLLQGTPPAQILCLTFTNAGAAEMLTRVQENLASWARLPQDDLAQILTGLLSHQATEQHITRARQLFLRVLDAPQGLQIQTIHSLCQSLLKRFALEANLSPHFKLMDAMQIDRLMQHARRQLLHGGQDEGTQTAIATLAAAYTGDDFDGLLNDIIQKRSQWQQWFAPANGPAQLRAKIRACHPQLAAGDPVAPYRMSPMLAEAIEVLAQGTKTDREAADKLRSASEARQSSAADGEKESLDCRGRSAPSQNGWKEYRAAFLTTKLTPRSRLITVNLGKKHPHIAEFLLEEQQRVLAYQQLLAHAELVCYSLALAQIAEGWLEIYDSLKQQQGWLDYEDLIARAAHLLSRSELAGWVRYKLDERMQHLLVDEAQDTNPLQWQIIRHLAEDFFSGEGAATDAPRTLFVVGDEKQSIFGFQGADPRVFGELKHFFADKIQQAQQRFLPVTLSLSFRSTPEVLAAVDAVFSQPQARDGLGDAVADSGTHHQAFRQGAGKVIRWPLMEAEEEQAGEALLAKSIAQRISGWIEQGRWLEARGRPIQPGDIMILVRSRSAFFYRLIRALKRQGLPVAGEDRLKLTEQLCVQDMLALCDFLLLPQDDLALACLLKSPFFGMEEAALFTLCHHRAKGETVWQRLRAAHPQWAQLLSGWLAQVDYLRPYDLLAQVLEGQGGRQLLAARLGQEVHDPLDELLNLARAHEQSGAASLQRFVHELRQGETEIKRDFEQASGQIRVMTVHGSKGLQAPVVVLPDTSSIPEKGDKVLMEADAGYIAPANAKIASFFAERKEQHKALQQQEYRRQLYVAMTRAADELYIGGWLQKNRKEVQEQSWYGLMEAVIPLDSSPQSLAPQGSSDKIPALQGHMTLPAWLARPAPEEPNPPRPLSPSRPQAEEPVDAPHYNPAAQLRGQVIHHLLEILPDIPPAQREEVGRRRIARMAVTLDALQREAWLGEVLGLLSHPDYADFFTSDSLAEVPITALLAGADASLPATILSGRIDRLVVRQEEVWILDYKTTRHVPRSAQDIPAATTRQMQHYAQVLARIYPHHRIRACLLYTAAPRLIAMPRLDIANS